MSSNYYLSRFHILSSRFSKYVREASGKNFILRRLARGIALDLEELSFNQNEYLDRETIWQYTRPHLLNLITHSYNNVKLYRDLFKKYKIKINNIQYPEDLSALPVVNKQMFLRTPEDRILAQNVPMERFVMGITSGSTGEPFRYFSDRKFFPAQKALLYRTWRWAGVDPNAATIQCSAPHSATFTPNTIFIHPHELQSEKWKSHIEKIKTSRARIIRGYPLTNLELAWKLREEERDKIKFTHAFFTGHVLSNGIKKFFRDNFQSEVYDYYGAMEVGPLASECKKHNGMHIHEDAFIIEIVDENNFSLPEGKFGRIIVTSLLNEAMPFIRYDTGDIGAIIPGQCACGRKSRRIVVDGRKEDLLIRPDGQCLHPGIIRDILDEYFSAFERYQIIQVAIDTLHLNVVPASNFSQNFLKQAIEKLKTCVGPLLKINYDVVSFIPPLPSGKFQYFISDYWRQRFPKEIFDFKNRY